MSEEEIKELIEWGIGYAIDVRGHDSATVCVVDNEILLTIDQCVFAVNLQYRGVEE